MSYGLAICWIDLAARGIAGLRTFSSQSATILVASVLLYVVVFDLTEWWGVGVVICLERGADLHIFQLMPLPLTVSCCSKIQIGFAFLVPAHPGSPGERAVKRVCVCVVFFDLNRFFIVFVCFS